MTTDDPNPFGKYATCRHWDFDYVENAMAYGNCDCEPEERREDDSCPDYHRRETQAERDAAMRAVLDAADAWHAGHKDDGRDVDLYEAAVALRAALLPEGEA